MAKKTAAERPTFARVKPAATADNYRELLGRAFDVECLVIELALHVGELPTVKEYRALGARITELEQKAEAIREKMITALGQPPQDKPMKKAGKRR